MARDTEQRRLHRPDPETCWSGFWCLCLFGLFLVWRIDSPRVERFRAPVIDAVVPSFDWALAPVTGAANLISDFQSYQQLREQNQELRRELQQMKSWKEAALQLEQENARLLDLNNVRLDPQADLCHRRGAGRQRLAVPAVGAAERGRARRDRRWLGDDGRDRACGADLGRGQETAAA